MDDPSSKSVEKENEYKRAPCSKPAFTLSQIKNTIPPHCFQRSLVRSLSYVVYDLCVASLLFYIATTYFQLLPRPLSYLAWPIYWGFQGCICTGIWVIAHECGHHGFSEYQWADDTVGLILHSSLLVPYFSWKYSHRRHHSNTGSMEQDEVYIPKQKSQLAWFYKCLNNHPPGRFLILFVTLTLGFPLYLAFNVSGRPYHRFASHYDPYAPIFSHQERLQVYISDIGIFATTYVLYRVAMAKGLIWLLSLYGMPLLVVNAFFVLITYIHHTHLSIPHYDSSEWDWLRGALATIDRDFGHLLNTLFHNVTNTHVLHHLFSTVPHYHALEATKAIKPILGEYYQIDSTPFFKAIWREAKECLYVDNDEVYPGVLWYKNKI